MTDKELLAIAETNDGLTVKEIKRYQKLVKPQKHVYGKYGTLKRKYLEDKGLDLTIENLPTYLHGVDKQAEDMYNVLYAKLSLSLFVFVFVTFVYYRFRLFHTTSSV